MNVIIKETGETKSFDMVDPLCNKTNNAYDFISDMGVIVGSEYVAQNGDAVIVDSGDGEYVCSQDVYDYFAGVISGYEDLQNRVDAAVIDGYEVGGMMREDENSWKYKSGLDFSDDPIWWLKDQNRILDEVLEKPLDK